MNQANISSSNSPMQTFLALALTASTVGYPNVGYDTKTPLPYYTTAAPCKNFNNNHTVSNIETFNKHYLGDLEHYRLVKDFGERLLSRSKDLDSQIAKIVDDNFWDLI